MWIWMARPKRCSSHHTRYHGHPGDGRGAAWVQPQGKTECVITFAGKGIMEARRALDWQENHAQPQYGDSGILRLVDSYKHLGTLHDKHLCRIPEVVLLAKAARTVIAASKRVLRNTFLPLPVRQAALACVDGVLFICSRVVVSSFEARVAFAKCSKVANVKPGLGDPTDVELRTQLKVPPASLVMQAARLRYLPRLLRHAPPRYVPSSGSPARVSGGRLW